jgi:proline iminopeptidase
VYPAIEPYATGMLDVGNGDQVYWEVCGNPQGKPALVVHGGPGSGCGPHWRRLFDPEKYRTVLFDQRGCGRSVPHASDLATDLRDNTTQHLIEDMEQLRGHLNIERWLLHGGSWGSTLILAYAEQHPDRVSEIVIAGVTTGRQSEFDWLYGGVGRFLPEQWERFVAASGRAADEDVLSAYHRLVESPDPAVREQATTDWCAWEDAVLSNETGGSFRPYGDRPSRDRVAFVRICAHYFSHRAWLEDGALLRDAHRLDGIPGVLIHGRLDLGGPLETAWLLARAWPTARLVVIEDAGHLGSSTTRDQVIRALDGFARK